jgi:hypothetical protein
LLASRQDNPATADRRREVELAKAGICHYFAMVCGGLDLVSLVVLHRRTMISVGAGAVA